MIHSLLLQSENPLLIHPVTNLNHSRFINTHFDKPYREASKQFYRKASQEYERNNGIVNYMSWADAKLNEEQRRAEKYLQPGEGCFSVNFLMDDLATVLVQNYQTQILDVYAGMIERNETEKLALMFSLLDRIDGGVNRMLKDFAGSYHPARLEGHDGVS